MSLPNEWLTSVLVRVYPVEGADAEGLKRLGRGLARWLDVTCRQDGFAVQEFGEYRTHGVESLLAGELPDPEALVVLNAFKEATRQGRFDAAAPAVQEAAERVAEMRLGEYLQAFPDGKRRAASFRVANAVGRRPQLRDSLRRALQAAGYARLELTHSVASRAGRITDHTHSWEGVG